MNQMLYQVDAFTSEPFSGNPAAVCILDEPAPEDWMQHVALEMNLAETAFLVAHHDRPGYTLRWFTPKVEVDLCGHATLASAHILWEQGFLQSDETAVFETRSGTLTARKEADGWIAMDFPAEPDEEILAKPVLDEALGATPLYVGRNRMDYIVLLDSEANVRALEPDLHRLATVKTRGVIVTARAEEASYDFVSRFFAPNAGVPEDPVTGSAHCCLGPFWQKRLGKDRLVGYQASARGGTVRVHVPPHGRVELGGQAVTVMRLTLLR